jgi:hypothetical protein
MHFSPAELNSKIKSLLIIALPAHSNVGRFDFQMSADFRRRGRSSRGDGSTSGGVHCRPPNTLERLWEEQETNLDRRQEC